MANKYMRYAVQAMRYGDIEFLLVRMTADLAKELLALNGANRPLREATSNGYKADMASGDWMFTADSIRFDSDGNMIDGQHRLLAMSKQPVSWSTTVLLVFGIDPDAQLVIDQGRRRTAGQQLALLGHKNANNLAALVRFLLIWERGLLFRNTNDHSVITSAVVENYVTDNEEVPSILAKHLKSITGCNMAPSVVGAFLVAAYRLDHSFAESFIHRLHTGTDLSQGSPILALRERSLRNRATGKKDSNREQLGLLIKAWNAEARGATMSKLQLPRGGTFTSKDFPRMVIPPQSPFVDFDSVSVRF